MVSRAVVFAVVAGATACHAFVPLGRPQVLRGSSLSISTRGDKASACRSILRINAGLWNPCNQAFMQGNTRGFTHSSKGQGTMLDYISDRVKEDNTKNRGQKTQTFTTKGESEFKTIRDDFKSIQEVQQALRAAGLESSNLIVGIDFTKSNKWTGEKSFGGRCLHDTTGPVNPYQQVIGIVGRTLEAFDDDHLIPAFGFGNTLTRDKSCFPLIPDRPCVGLSELLDRYKEIAPGMALSLSGPTNFAPTIDKAIEIVRAEKSYHILVLIADGQVDNKEDTVRALVRASSFPLSIIMIGVGDGPWDMMRRFDDELPQRKFDNFQFVCFNEIKNRFRELEKDGSWESPVTASEVDACCAMAMLMEIPEQYKAIRQLRLLGAT